MSASGRRDNPNSTEESEFTFRATRRDFLREPVHIARTRGVTYQVPVMYVSTALTLSHCLFLKQNFEQPRSTIAITPTF
jgi:hypothetical protein